MNAAGRKRAIQAGWDEMAEGYQRGAVIATREVHYGPLIPGERAFGLLGDVRGRRVLELACGGAQNAIALAGQGAIATAVDISPKQLAHARRLARRERADVHLILGDIERLGMFADQTFDAIVSSNGIEFVEDLASCLREWRRVLKVGGRLAMSTVHPLAAFEWDARRRALIVEDYFSPPMEVWRDLVGREARRGFTLFRGVEEIFGSLVEAGFAVERVLEPAPRPASAMSEREKDEIPYRGAIWERRQHGRMMRIPFTIIYAAKRTD